MMRFSGFEISQQASAADPLPVLLVLGPAMAAGPWPLAVARAASTLQMPEDPRGLGLPSAQAALAYGVLVQRVERIVVCGEGYGTPVGLVSASLEARAQAVTAALRSADTGATVPVSVLYHDRGLQRLLAWGLSTARYLPVDRAADPLLWALVRPGGGRG